MSKKTLTIDEDKAKELYKTGSPEIKAILENTFGKEFFIESIMDKVKCYAEANNIYYNNVEAQFRSTVPMYVYPKFKNKIAYYAQAILIAEVLNEGWEPDWNNSSQIKWTTSYNSSTHTYIPCHYYYCNSSLIYFKSEKLAEYFIKQFPDICNTLYK